MMKKIDNDYYRDERTWCCLLHPGELVIGVCALCLNEKLLVLAASSKQRHNTSYGISPKSALPKIFALTSLLNRLDINKQKPVVYESSSTSQEDSFISIKFEENGVASWDRSGRKTSNTITSLHHQPETLSNKTNHNKTEKIKTIIEHTKPRAAMRWRKRISHLFQLIKWKRSNKGSVRHVGSKLHEESKNKRTIV